MIKSKFFRATDVQGMPPIVLTIAEVTEELLGRGTRQDMKCFLWFKENLKGLQLNKSRVRTLEAAYGPDSDLWIGRRVRLSFDPTVEFGGRAVGGVRLETSPGVVYTPAAHAAAWGGPPPGVPTAPPQPVWDPVTNAWVLPAPAPAPAPAPSAAPRPPQPVWDAVSNSWVLPGPAAAAPAPDPMMGGAPTISQRIAAGSPTAAAAEWVDSSTGEVRTGDDFNDKIPF
jgi:hypothetical protein